MPPHHPQCPHPPHCEGRADRGYPNTQTPQTDTHHTPRHTPGNEQYTTRPQY
nr:MAG TPA: hypothetical protein [Caudoviricetes sp.]